MLHSGNTLARSYAAFDIVAIAASWGGVAVLSHLLSALPADFAAPIVVVQHLNPKHRSQLDAVLGQRTRLAVCWAKDSVPLRPGTVFLAPPDCHVQVTPSRTLRLWQGPKVNFTRPAADPLFESVAAVSGARAIGVVLTGLGRDGARGAQAIKGAGGRVLVQDPATAPAPNMPVAVINSGSVDFWLPPSTLASALTSLVMVPGAAVLFDVQARSPHKAFLPARSNPWAVNPTGATRDRGQPSAAVDDWEHSP